MMVMGFLLGIKCGRDGRPSAFYFSFCLDDACLGISRDKGGVVINSGDAGCGLSCPSDHGSWANDFTSGVCVYLEIGVTVPTSESRDEKSV